MQNLKQVSNFVGHKDKAWNLSWNPTGTILASCGGDRIINLWVKEGDEYQRKFQLEGAHNRTIRSVAWSPCGNYIAAASFDGTTSLWQLVEGQFTFVASLEGHENEVKCVAWSSSGLFIATCSRDKSVWIWDGYYTRKRRDKRFHFNKQGDKLASCSADKTVKIWHKFLPDNAQGIPVTNIQKWKCMCTIDGMHNRTIYSVCWDFTSGCIATGCGDDIIRVFKPSAEVEGHTTYDLIATAISELGNDVNSVDWKPTPNGDGGGDNTTRTIASCDDSGLIVLWTIDLEE